MGKIAALGVFLSWAACSAHADENFGTLTVQQVQEKRTQKNVYVYDNNAQARFTQSRVAGARWVSPYEIKAKDLPPDKSATLIFYCANEH